ncbi:MAG: hypothetical protein WB662_09220 [Methyloceanibacter sp.]
MHALTVAAAILEATSLGDIHFYRACGGGFEDVHVELPYPARIEPDHMADDQEMTPKDRTAAERQRRCRAKRDNVHDSVTDANCNDLLLLNGADHHRDLGV